RRNACIALRVDTIDHGANGAVEPVVIHDPVLRGNRARAERGMTCAGDSMIEGIVTILEPRAVPQQTLQTVVTEQALPADQVVATHLIEHNQHCEARRGRFRWLCGMSSWDEDRDAGKSYHGEEL